MPSFGTPWGFVIGVPSLEQTVASMRIDEIDSRMTDRMAGHSYYYDGVAHQGMFSMPKYIRTAFLEEVRLITQNQPLYAV